MVASLRALLRMMSHRSLLSMITAASALILASLTLTTGSQPAVASGATYYVAPDGYDSNPGTLDLPWRTIGHALKQLYAGDTLYIRGGTYASPSGGWYLIHSGTADQPITITNQPGEQVVVKVNEVGIWYSPFVCNSEGSGQKADHVRLMGSDVSPRTLSNGLTSSKGIVIQGPDSGYTEAAGVRIWDCDYWEVAGLDLIRMGYGLFGHTFGNDHWYVHHNRVYSNSREAGMQFNGPHHTIEYNEVIRDRPDYQSPYGCSHIALLAYGNHVRGNVLDYAQPMRNQQGNLVHCVGILLEWDIADDNVIEANVIRHMDKAFDFAGGDNNIVRNNIILTGNSGYVDAGFYIRAYPDGTNSWPCNNEWLQPSNPSDPAYAHFWNPRNCHSRDNQIYNNVVVGFKKGVLFDNSIPEGSTYVRNNAFVNLSEGGICNWSRCGSFDGVTEDHNVFNAPYGFVDEAHEDFHLLSTSPLRDVGYDMGDLVPTDFDGSPRPQGAAYDVGAYEYGSENPPPRPTPIPSPTPTPQPEDPGPGVLPGLAWEAEDGVITAPFVIAGAYVYQSTSTDANPLSGGKGSYLFDLTIPGDYVVRAVVDAPSDGSDSFFVQIDSEPTSAATWHIGVTQGLEERSVSWGGSSAPQVFTLSAGQHELIFRGREPMTTLDKVSVEPVGLPVRGFFPLIIHR
jgi:hypothetical protein